MEAMFVPTVGLLPTVRDPLGGEALPVSRDPGRAVARDGSIAAVKAGAHVALAFAKCIMRLPGGRATLGFERLLGLVRAAIAVEPIVRGGGRLDAGR